jgi:hypothetical protein
VRAGAATAAATSGLRGLGVAFTLIFMVFPFNPVVQTKNPGKFPHRGLKDTGPGSAMLPMAPSVMRGASGKSTCCQPARTWVSFLFDG